ncbi:translocation/assembly module TamB domain-containing protein [Chitinibacter sp. GC72]|uniref:translocation/assembly module TamB domain-containing protein n=1 Tax=Chitinibacter sp. GC72 TaxID=1526917 RepID=UPI0012FA0894|nr:translocation/assembly module TamB domain-containing protein [Chitinibacter sp. GC72]
MTTSGLPDPATPATEQVESLAAPAAEPQEAGRQGSKPPYGFVRRLLRAVFWSTLVTFSLIALLLFLALSWFNSASGRYWLTDAINRSQVVSVAAIEGSFWSELQIKQLSVKTDDLTLALDYGVFEWEPYMLLLRDLYLPKVSLGELSIQTKAAPPNAPPTPAPDSLSLPFGIHLDEFSLAKLNINGNLLTDIRGRVSSNGRFHRLQLEQLQVPQGRLAAALNITGKKPFHSAGSFVLSGQLEGEAIQAVGQLEGPLRALMVQASVTHPRLSGKISVQADAFAPYAYQLVRQGQINVRGLNPSLWQSDAPQARLDLDARFEPVKDGVDGQLTLKNHLPGALDQHQLPLLHATLQFALRDQTLNIARLDVQLPGKSSVQARGQIEQGTLDLQLQAQQIDPQTLWSPQPKGEMNGKLQLKGPWLTPGVSGEISDVQRQAKLKLDIGWIKPETERRLAIRQLQLSRGGSQLAAKGEFNLQAQQDFAAELTLKNINPAEFAQIPAGRISGQANIKGKLQPKPLLDLQFQLQDSVFNQQALTGRGSVQLSAERLSQSDFWLALGNNRISASGALGLPADRLQLVLDVPNLAVLGSQFAGRIDGDATLSGALLHPRVDARLQIRQLATPFAVKVQQADIDLALSSDLQGPIRIGGKVQQLVYAQTRLDQLTLAINGTMQQHDINLQATGRQAMAPPEPGKAESGELVALALDWQSRGGFDAQRRWQGQILALSGQAGLPFKLQNSPKLVLASDEFDLDPASLAIGASQIQLQQTQWKKGTFVSSGQLRSLALAEWLKLGKIANPVSDLQLVGDWQIRQSGVLNGTFNLARVSGDVRWHDAQRGVIPLTLRKLSASGQLEMNRLNIQAQLESEKFGQLGLTASALADLAQGGFDAAAPVSASIKGTLPNLSVFAPFLGPDTKLAGDAVLDVRVSGSVSEPQLGGSIRAAHLLYADTQAGIKLQDGELELALSNQDAILKSFSAKSVSKGEIKASGSLSLAGGKPNGQLKLLAERFTLISKPEMLLVLSGQGGLSVVDGVLSVNGSFKADAGDIQYQSSDVPKLSNDVRVIGRENKPRSANVMKLNMLLDFDLGDQFVFRGYGLESRLLGKLRLNAVPNQLLTASGTITTEGGEYKAYGQKLVIERGILSFQGAVDNPSLDILAMRRNQAVEAGVQVSGHAYAPRVSLYSEPNVPDAEKISWLLFGHGSDSMAKSDGALVLQLLNAMASNGGNGKGLTDEILGNFGIDEVGYKSKEEDDGTTTQVVTVSKHLSKSLRVSLEKSFNGLSDAVSFTLQLSRNWSLVSRIGVDNSAVDVKYTLTSD